MTEGAPSGGQAPDPTSTQIRGSSLLLSGQLFAVIVNLAAQVLIVRYLTQESYAAFAYALSIGLIADAVAAFGMRRGVSRYVPLYQESGDLARAAGTLVLGSGVVLGLGLAIVLIVAGFRGAIAGGLSDDTTAVTVLVLLTLLVPIQALGTVLDSVFAAFNRPRPIVARKYVITPLTRLVVIGLLVASDQDVIFLSVGYVVTGVLGLVLYLPALMGLLRERALLRMLRPGRFAMPVRRVMGFTLPLLYNDITAATFTNGGAVALGLLAAPTDVAELRAVFPVALTMTYVLSSFEPLLVPLASRLHHRGETVALNRLYWTTLLWISTLAFPIFISCVVLAEPLTVLLFGERYESAGPVLAILALGHFVSTSVGSNGILLGVYGQGRFMAYANLAALALSLGLFAILIPSFGAVGAACATTATFLTVSVIRQVGLWRRSEIHALPAIARGPYVTMFAATAGALAIQLSVDPPAVIGLLLVAAAVLLVFARARSALALGEHFPELMSVPWLGRLLGADRNP